MMSYMSILLGLSLAAWLPSEIILAVSLAAFSTLINIIEYATKTTLLFYWDFLSNSLVSLSVWVFMLAMLASTKIFNDNNYKGLFMLQVSILLFMLLVTFSVKSLLFFFIFFEACLIPLFILIMGWGYQPERSSAGLYMMLYTLAGSLPLLAMLLSVTSGGILSFFSYVYKPIINSPVALLFLHSAFLIKFPIYGAHLWLLKAHVEAPVSGSMILAGVLLKLGGYGIVRVSPLCVISQGLTTMLISGSLVGGVLMGLACIRATDMKLLIAASSVVHMSGCIIGLFSGLLWGLSGAIIMMLAHGLCSSGLFYLANTMYLKSQTRSILLTSGLLNLAPALSMWLFLLVSANMAAPPTSNLLAELMIIVSACSYSKVYVVPLMALALISGAYSIYMFASTQHGSSFFSRWFMLSDSTLSQLISYLHFSPIIFMVPVSQMIS